MIQKPYVPIVKRKGFCPNPVAGNIPIWADSKINPSVIDTQKFRDFWDEQFEYCRNGYDTGGIHVPGRYYYYLNFVILNGLMGPMYPMYVDLDLEYYQLVDYVKEHNKPGVISIKARRKGLSEKAQAILGHGLRFIESYKGGVCAGLEVYQVELRNKFTSSQNNMRPELKLNLLEDNDKIYRPGYKIKAPTGFVEESFSLGLKFETLFDNPKKLEGEYFHDVIYEESGQNKVLSKAHESIDPALKFGMFYKGTHLIYGTGGNILSTSKDFKFMWDHADTLKLEKFWVPGTRLYFPFFGNSVQETFEDPDTGEIVDAIPNLRHLKPHERIGCEDLKAAEEYILKKRVEYAKLPDKTKLKELNQSFPLTVEEAFTSGGSNNFNSDLIYNRLFEIEADPNRYTPYILDFVYEPNPETGVKQLKFPLEVNARPAKKGDPDGEIVYIYQLPRKDILDLDVGGIDGYNQDETQTSSSLGAMTVIRQGNLVNLSHEGIHNARYPVCLYYKRPSRKETFYGTCLKISIFYNLVKNTMINAEQDFVIDYYTKNYGTRYLSPRPKSFDAPKTEQKHKFGAKMTGFSKPRILGIVQSYFEDYTEYNNFPEMLRDGLAYDEAYIGTDWDSIDALAYALMRCEDMRVKPRRNSDTGYEYTTTEWRADSDGNLRLISNEHAIVDKKDDGNIPKEGDQGWYQSPY